MYSLYLQHTAVRYSHYNSSTQIEYTVSARIYGKCTLSTHLEYIVTASATLRLLIHCVHHNVICLSYLQPHPGSCT